MLFLGLVSPVYVGDCRLVRACGTLVDALASKYFALSVFGYLVIVNLRFTIFGAVLQATTTLDSTIPTHCAILLWAYIQVLEDRSYQYVPMSNVA